MFAMFAPSTRVSNYRGMVGILPARYWVDIHHAHIPGNLRIGWHCKPGCIYLLSILCTRLTRLQA
jgi:hypothetical protein